MRRLLFCVNFDSNVCLICLSNMCLSKRTGQPICPTQPTLAAASSAHVLELVRWLVRLLVHGSGAAGGSAVATQLRVFDRELVVVRHLLTHLRRDRDA